MSYFINIHRFVPGIGWLRWTEQYHRSTFGDTIGAFPVDDWITGVAGVWLIDAVEFWYLSSVHFIDSLREIPELHLIIENPPEKRPCASKQNNTAERTAGQPQRLN